ncbi:MAG: D-tyrosyl-tRNA(Tyr) deacylase [Flavobacteriales bacterium]|nr:D-tyrosyl-tRNA(Tyr) deacylase [Flavobacteriales bacterium]
MRVVLQRVSEAKVSVNQKVIGEINTGLLLLVGIAADDEPADVDWLCKKICNMRIFNDQEGKMNLSLLDVQGDLLSISQFTLHASTKKGNRPSFIYAAKPEFAEKMYLQFNENLAKLLGKKIQQGQFGADMKVSLLNDGPVTLIIDSKDKV